MVDIVLGTYNRQAYLLKTLSYIYSRTSMSFKLHIINDGSSDNTDLVVRAFNLTGEIDYVEREVPKGIAENLLWAIDNANSEIFVFTDDDVLCPDITPDWLYVGLSKFSKYPRLGLLGLNDPGCNINGRRHIAEQQKYADLTKCCYLGGQFLFIRKAAVQKIDREMLQGTSPVKRLCMQLLKDWDVAYFKDVYCYHFGCISARTGKDVSSLLLKPENSVTLEPPKKWRY